MRKKPSFRALKHKLDVVFSQWIRRKNATSEGLAVCVTCTKVAPWKSLQCGHYVSRVYLATRWDERNAAVQCGACNVLKRGNYSEYTEYMIRKYGVGVISELNARKRAVVKYTLDDLESLIGFYQQKLQAL